MVPVWFGSGFGTVHPFSYKWHGERERAKVSTESGNRFANGISGEKRTVWSVDWLTPLNPEGKRERERRGRLETEKREREGERLIGTPPRHSLPSESISKSFKDVDFTSCRIGPVVLS